MPRRALVLLAAAPLLAQSQATFYAAYEEGLVLQGRGKAGAALAAFQRAVELRPKPGGRTLTYGTNFLEAYHPWIHLAQCALAVKDLAAAEEALKRSDQYGVEPAAERARLRQQLEALKAPAPAQPQPAPVQAAPQPQTQAPAPVQVPAPVPSTAVPLQAPASKGQPAAPPKGTVPEPKEASVKAPAPSASIPAPTPASSSAPVQAPAAAAPAPVTAPPPAPDRRPYWALAAVLAAGLGALGLRRRKPAAAPAPDHEATRRLEDTDRTRLLASQGAPTALRMDQTQQGEMVLGRYRLRRVLGKGACGTTYLGEADADGHQVAIKVPHPHMLEDAEFLARFRQEASLGTRLDHPGIVRIIDPGPVEGTPWLAMELVRGRPLDEELKARGALPVGEVLDVALQVAEALAYAHAQGVVHRDLKPSNVMLGERGAQVLDFGIARLTEGVGMTATQVFIGTPLYAAPEAVTHSKVGPAADRYALGVMLFHLLSGRPPFEGPTTFAVLQAHLSAPAPDLGRERPELPARLVRLVERLMDKRPDQRPEDGEVVRILKEIRAEG